MAKGYRIIIVGLILGALILAGSASGLTNISSCATIDIPGVYSLNTSIINTNATSCINITSSDVFFDGQGNTIDGTGEANTYGIYVYNATTSLTNVTVKNLNVTDWYLGINYQNAQNGSIENNSASSNEYGIFLDPSNNNTLTNNSASYNFQSGFAIVSSSGNTLIDNSASFNGKSGFQLDTDSNNNTLINNTAYNNTEHGFAFNSSSSNILSDNAAYNNDIHGLVLILNSNFNTLINNLAYSNIANGFQLDTNSTNNNLTDNNASSNDFGIVLSSSSNNTLTGNTAGSNTNYGIFLSSSSNNSLSNNTALLNWQGIYLFSSSYNTLTSNNVSPNTIGIYLTSSSNNSLTNNSVNSNQYGIYLAAFSNLNTLTSNTAGSNSVSGIFIQSSKNNTLSNNNASFNLDSGIHLMESTNNILTGNNASSNSNRGIRLESHSDDNILSNNNASFNSDSGIYLKDSRRNTLSNNSASSNNDSGIYLRDSSNNNSLISNNASLNINSGIYITTSASNILNKNNISYNTGKGIYLQSTYASSKIPEVSFNWTQVNVSTANATTNGSYLNDSGNYTLQDDDGYFIYELPFSFTFMGRSIVNISVNTNGLIELLESSESCYECDDYGTHADEDHVDNIDAIFTSNDDLETDDQPGAYVGVFNLGDRVVIEWNGSTYEDYDTLSYPILFQVVLYPYGIIEWNFKTMNWSLYSYHLFSGAYAREENLEFEAGYAINYQTSFRNNFTTAPPNLVSNRIYNNTIVENSDEGIYLNRSGDNLIYNNYFANSINAWSDTANQWNTTKTAGSNIIGGVYMGGNYWSDYAGVDTDGDGLGDTLLPYDSVGNISDDGDYHPLTAAAIIRAPSTGDGGGQPSISRGEQVLVVANTIDLSFASDFLSYLRENNIKPTVINASQLTETAKVENRILIILGGPDAYDGIGDIVRGILSDAEVKAVRQADSQLMYTKYNVWTDRYTAKQKVLIVAGADRFNTKEAETKHGADVVAKVLN